ncbi:ChaB family protein [Rickettsia hoogstraalii]|uniref:ChaB family protein n=1 Tax=Rickettsia hoogstraalii TaxID=467174 RepID=UPI0038B64EB2
MPYKNNNDLPDSVKNHLPSHAKDIYREAFNMHLNNIRMPIKDAEMTPERQSHIK